MKLVIFDVDGTLTNSAIFDKELYDQVFKEVLNSGFDDVSQGDYDYVTDKGILHRLCMEKHGRSYTEDEHSQVREKFHNKLYQFAEDKPELFTEIAGAGALIPFLEQNNIAVAISTGCWYDSAALKLSKCNIKHDHLPFANADLAIKRSEICLKAIELASKMHSRESFDSISYVGDGLWDLEVTDNLGYNFIGMDHTSNGELNQAGAQKVLNHYHDKEGFLSLLP